MAPSKTEQPARDDQPKTSNAPATIRPDLFMAARHGKSEQLKHLLDVEDAEAPAQSTAVSAEVIVEVDRTALSGEQLKHLLEVEDAEPPAQPTAVSAEVIVEDDWPALSGALLLEGVTIDGDSVLHIVAASGDGEEFLECAKVIYGKARHLLDARNKKGDTPLHCAAGAGNVKMVSCLVARVSGEDDSNDERVKEFLRMQNECGETALHQAVRSSNKDSMGLLMSMDSELACVPQEGTSPLYLAISLGQVEIARYLFDKTNKKLSYSGPDGQNVLHAAIPRGEEALPILLERCKDQTVQIQEGERHRSVPLLSHLTNQRDKNGSTPLHLAASLEGWWWKEFLSRWLQHDWTKSSKKTELLLDANKSTVYQPDNEGLYPIHVAASNGSLKVVKILVRRCPDCATLRDGQGRTFLHVAVEKGMYSVVKYACGTPEFASILNVHDNNGDTALHRAVHVGNLAVFNCVIRNHQVHLSLPNKGGLAPLDISRREISSKFYFPYNPRSIIQHSLILLGASSGDNRPDHFYRKYIPKIDEDKASEILTDSTQVLGIVSVLIATVTFAAAFTLPGGYRADDHANGGTPMLAGSYAFDAFIISDTLAFICSTVATFCLVFAGVPAVDLSIRKIYIIRSATLLRNSGRSLVAAFALGLYVVLAPVAHNIAVTVCVLIFSPFLYGHFELWQVICLANTGRARHGIRVPAAWVHVLWSLIIVLTTFWSYIIIFGLPAIWKTHRT